MIIFNLSSQQQLEYCTDNLEDTIEQIHEHLKETGNVKFCAALLSHLSQLDCPNCLDPLLPHFTHQLFSELFDSCPFHPFLQQFKALTPLQIQQRSRLNHQVAQTEYHLSLLFSAFSDTINTRIIEPQYLLRLLNKLSQRKCDHTLKVALHGVLCLVPYLKAHYSPNLSIISNFTKHTLRKSFKSKSLKTSLNEFILYHQSRYMADFQFYRLLSCTPLPNNALNPLLAQLPQEIVDMICTDLSLSDKCNLYQSTPILYNKRNIQFQNIQLSRSTDPSAIKSLVTSILKHPQQSHFNALITKKLFLLVDAMDTEFIISILSQFTPLFIQSTTLYHSLSSTDPLCEYPSQTQIIPLIHYFMIHVEQASSLLWQIKPIRLFLLEYYIQHDLQTAMDLYMQQADTTAYTSIPNAILQAILYNCDVQSYWKLKSSCLVFQNVKLKYKRIGYEDTLIKIRKDPELRTQILEMVRDLLPQLCKDEETWFCFIKHVFRLGLWEVAEDIMSVGKCSATVKRVDSALNHVEMGEINETSKMANWTQSLPFYAFDAVHYKLKNLIYSKLNEFDLEFNEGCFYSILLGIHEFELFSELMMNDENREFIKCNIQNIYDGAMEFEASGRVRSYLEKEFYLLGLELELEDEEEDEDGESSMYDD